MMGGLRSIAGSLLLTLLSGCVTPIDTDRGFPPFYLEREEVLADGEVRQSQHFWPFYSHSTTTPDREEIRILWPLFVDRIDQTGRKTWLLPAYHRRAYRHSDDQLDVDSFLLPFFLWGSDRDEGDYAAFAPIGGSLKGLLGKDRIDFALFPLWARMQDRQQITTYWLFPLIELDEGPLRSGFRIFPFYSSTQGFTSHGKLRDQSRYVLWPFWHQSSQQLDTDNPSHSWWLWPFYGQIESGTRLSRTILYPLWTESHDFRTETSTWSLLPWSIGTRERQWNRFLFPPFWGYHDRPGLKKGYFLWPLWQWEKQSTATRERTVQRLFPFWRRIVDQDPQRGTRSSHLLWPLARWDTDAEGNTTASAPALLPFDSPQGFSWSHGRAGQLIRWRQESQSWGLELLWGLLTAESSEQKGGFSLLGGLLSRDRGAGADDTRWRLLYIPF